MHNIKALSRLGFNPVLRPVRTKVTTLDKEAQIYNDYICDNILESVFYRFKDTWVTEYGLYTYTHTMNNLSSYTRYGPSSLSDYVPQTVEIDNSDKYRLMNRKLQRIFSMHSILGR